MWLKMYLFFVYSILFCNQYNVAIGKPMYGENVKHANENEFPFVASLMSVNDTYFNPQINHECTGTLISKRNLLTCAHCLKNKETHEINIIIGSIDIMKGKIYNPLSWITYETWGRLKKKNNLKQLHDIANIKLTEEVADYITPVPLRPMKKMDLYGLDLVVAGWGVTISGEVSRIMETVSLKVLTNFECALKASEVQGKLGYLEEKYLCTKSDPIAVMSSGNSGSPLMYQGSLVAIHKGTLLYKNQPFHPDKLNIHVSLETYEDFIKDIIENY